MGQRHPLPYGFAKANNLLLEDDGEQLLLRLADNTPRSALTEVLRLYAVDTLEREDPAALAQRLAAA
jgi:general secretion pathway protein E